jgi:hypothetical protein
MANKVVLKRSAVEGKTPTTSDLALGELALNTYDGNLFFKKDVSGSESILSVATLTGTQTLTNKTLTTPNISNPVFTTDGGDEGGQVTFALAETNTTLSTGVNVDIFRNRFRIFESGGSNRGVFIDLSTTGESVGSQIVTTNQTQTLTNKTLSNPVINGSFTAGGSTGTNGDVLTSTGTGLQWVTPAGNTLDGLSDVVINSPEAQQVLKYNGSNWINADADTAVASAVFATNAESDLGLVTDLIIGIEEDLGSVTDTAAFIYNMGQLRVDGIVSLENLDQSVKADYIAYSIIFGF